MSLVLLSTSCALSADFACLTLCLTSVCVKLSATRTVSSSSALVFAFNKEMTQEDLFKEMNQKVHTWTLPNKLIMQVFITMTYEARCTTARAATAAANVPYVPHTMIQYLQLIDRFTYALHVTAVAAALLAGHVASAASPFSETVADAHDELQKDFDVHVAVLHWNVVHVGRRWNPGCHS